jgi:hypothetical protein
MTWQTPVISPAAIAGARALLARPDVLEKITPISCDPGYEGDWDINYKQLEAAWGEAAVAVPAFAASLADEAFMREVDCRISTTDTGEPGPYDFDENDSDDDDDYYDWGGQREATDEDLRHALEIAIEVIEREGWIGRLHEWEATDNQGYSMECTVCEIHWSIYDEDSVNADTDLCPGAPVRNENTEES